MEILKNKKVIIKPFDKHRPFFPAGHDGRVRYTGCTSGYTLPWKNGNRSFVKIFEDGEQAAFEKALDLEPGTLNLFKRKGSWFSKFIISLTKEDKELDLNSPIQALEYRVLKANKDLVCLSKGEYNGTQEYYIEDEGVLDEDNYKVAQKSEKAMDLFIKLRKSDKQMYDLLRVLGKKPSKEILANTQALKSELNKIILQFEKVSGIPNIDDFINAASDELFQEKVFVLDGLEIGEIELVSGVYKIKEGGQPVGRSLQQVAEYFNVPKNQDNKLLIQQRIELNK